MKLTSIAVAIATCALVSAAPQETQEKEKGQARRDRPELTEEQKAERKAAADKRKAEYDALSDEEKAALKAEMEKRRAEWAKLTPEERKAKMEEGRAKMKALTDKYDKDGDGKLNAAERKALSEDPELKKLRANMPGRGGNRGARPDRGDRGQGGGKKADKPADQ